MWGLAIKISFFLMLFILTGCTSYRIPIQTQNHPASTQAKVFQIDLSPILDIPESSDVKKNDAHSHD